MNTSVSLLNNEYVFDIYKNPVTITLPVSLNSTTSSSAFELWIYFAFSNPLALTQIQLRCTNGYITPTASTIVSSAYTYPYSFAKFDFAFDFIQSISRYIFTIGANSPTFLFGGNGTPYFVLRNTSGIVYTNDFIPSLSNKTFENFTFNTPELLSSNATLIVTQPGFTDTDNTQGIIDLYETSSPSTPIYTATNVSITNTFDGTGITYSINIPSILNPNTSYFLNFSNVTTPANSLLTFFGSTVNGIFLPKGSVVVYANMRTIQPVTFTPQANNPVEVISLPTTLTVNAVGTGVILGGLFYGNAPAIGGGSFNVELYDNTSILLDSALITVPESWAPIILPFQFFVGSFMRKHLQYTFELTPASGIIELYGENNIPKFTINTTSYIVNILPSMQLTGFVGDSTDVVEFNSKAVENAFSLTTNVTRVFANKDRNYYRVKLVNLVIPVGNLTIGYSTKDLPYIYVDLYNNGFLGNQSKIASNNPSSIYTTFKLALTHKTNWTTFITLSSDDEVVLLFKPDLDIQLNVRGPDGQILKWSTTDSFSPLYPNQFLQISAFIHIAPYVEEIQEE
jgi:hypothetical protein